MYNIFSGLECCINLIQDVQLIFVKPMRVFLHQGFTGHWAIQVLFVQRYQLATIFMGQSYKHSKVFGRKWGINTINFTQRGWWLALVTFWLLNLRGPNMTCKSYITLMRSRKNESLSCHGWVGKLTLFPSTSKWVKLTVILHCGGANISQMQFLLAGYRSGNEGDVMVPLEASIKPPQASETKEAKRK